MPASSAENPGGRRACLIYEAKMVGCAAFWTREDDVVKGLLGKKVGMTQVFTEDGNLVSVTVIDVSSCIVVGKRTPEKDKYSAITLGVGEVKESRLNGPQKGFFKKSGAAPRGILKEVRMSAEDAAKATIGEAVKVEMFAAGELVDVTGITKGRGFQGVMRRWSFKGSQTKTHGTHEYQRHPGAIGQRKTPGRVYPNKKMPGHYGVEQVTTQNLRVIKVLPEKGLLLVSGAVPGHREGTVFVRNSVKKALRDAHKKSAAA